MPYNISKKAGGDTAANDARVERQVNALMRRGFDKGHAIAIAKASLDKHAMHKGKKR